MIEKIDFSVAERHVLVAHAFVTGAQTSESEQVVVGTVDSIPVSLFSRFDYVALGHLHRPQTLGGQVRYSGSPLCYSFSEVNDVKSVTLVELGEQTQISTIPLHPVHPMREVRGTMAELMQMPYSEDYVRAVVTDEEVLPDARVTLQSVFPNLMRFAVENSRTAREETGEFESVTLRDPLSLFAEFYEQQTGVVPDEARLALMRGLFAEKEESQ